MPPKTGRKINEYNAYLQPPEWRSPGGMPFKKQ